MARAIWAVACLISVIWFLHAGNARAAWPEIESEPIVPTVSSKPASPVPTPAPPPVNKAPSETLPKDNAIATSAPGDTYRMGPEDVVRVSVWENKELTLDVVVRPDGKISLPLIQDVQAEGLTASELADIVHSRLESFIKDPQVSVILLQVNAPKIFVIGNVARPGPYPLRGETSVLQALSLAGGFSQFASPRSIKLVRKNRGKQEVRKLNYYNLIDDEGEGNHLLKPGDTIVVP